MMEEFFNTIFNSEEGAVIRSSKRAEPWNTMRQAFALFAYMSDFSEYDISKVIGRKPMHVRYLIEKAEDLYSINDRLITNTMMAYEKKMAQSRGRDSEPAE